MDSVTTATAPTEPTPDTGSAPADEHVPTEDSLVADELLVEEVSIDGMCGVY